MKARLFVALAMVMSLSTVAVGADQPMDAKAQDMMKKMQEYATPGAPHKQLAEMAGNWKYNSKFWHMPEGKAQESTGTSKMKMILGGRYLQHETKGTAMGQPFEGMGLTAYDNIKGKYETVWLDTMGTGMMKGMGTYDAATKTLKDSGSFSCPLSADKQGEYRGEWQIVDKNKMVYAMYGAPPEGGKEFKQMEMTFTRTK